MATYAEEVLADNPVCYYRLADVTTTLEDSGPNNLDGATWEGRTFRCPQSRPVRRV